MPAVFQLVDQSTHAAVAAAAAATLVQAPSVPMLVQKWRLHRRAMVWCPSAKELLKAGMAVGLVILLLEGALVQLAQAEGADKVFWVVFSEHGRDAAARYGLVAARTQRAPLGMIVCLAERLALVVVEAATIEWLPAIAADKTLWVPLAVQG